MSRRRNHKSWTRETSALAHAAKRRRRLEGPTPDYFVRPSVGLLLKTIRVTDELGGASFEIKLRQAERLNQVTVETFGRVSKPRGIDWLVRHLRQRLVTRWLRPI